MALNRNARYTGENDTEDQAQIKLDKIIATIQSQPHYKNPDGKISQDGREYLAFIEMLKKQGHKPTDILVSKWLPLSFLILT